MQKKNQNLHYLHKLLLWLPQQPWWQWSISIGIATGVCLGFTPVANAQVFTTNPVTAVNGGGTTITSSETGSFFYLRIPYSCSGSSDCTGETITGTLPPELEQISLVNSVHTDSSSFNSATGEYTFNMGTIPSGTISSVSVEVNFPSGITPDGTTTSSGPSVTAEASDEDWYLKKTQLGPVSGDPSPGENAVYKLELCFQDRQGILNLNGVTLTDTFDANATVVDPGGGTVTGNTITWNLGDVKEGDIPLSDTCFFEKTVTLNYPSGSFSNGSSATNTLTGTGTPLGESNPVNINVDADGDTNPDNIISHQFTTANPSLSITKTLGGSGNIAQGGLTPFQIALANDGNELVESAVVTDTIPGNVVLKEIYTGKYEQLAGNIQVEYKTNTNTNWTIWSSTLTADQTIQVSSLGLGGSEYITDVRVTYLGGAPVGFATESDAPLELRVEPASTASVGDNVNNCANFDGINDGNALGTETDCAQGTIQGLTPNVHTQKWIQSSAYTSYDFSTYETKNPGEEFIYALSFELPAGSNPLTNPYVMDFLPPELEYAGSYDWRLGYEGSSTANAPDQFEVLDNYNATGRTLLRWHWTNHTFTSYVRGTIFVRVRVKAGTPATDFAIENTMQVMTNSSPIACNTNNVGDAGTLATDTNDLDGDGDTTDLLCFDDTEPEIQILSLTTLDAIKEVQGQLDATYLPGGSTGETVPGGRVNYRLTITNTGNVDTKELVVYDILPYVGDTSVKPGVLASRDSDWQPTLTAAVTAPTGVTVSYSDSTNPCRPEIATVAGCVDDWTTTPDNFTDVRSLRFQYTPIFNSGDQLLLTWDMEAPSTGVNPGEIAWSSFAYTAKRADNSEAIDVAEPPKVGIKVNSVVPGIIGNYVWSDTNEDGIQQSGEPGLNGITVEVWQDDGDGTFDAASDTLINTMQTEDDTSGNPGYYLFSNLPAGNYFIRGIPGAGQQFSTQGAGSDGSIDSDVDPNTGVSALITVNGTTDNRDLDAGVVPARASNPNITLVKRITAINGTPITTIVDDTTDNPSTTDADESIFDNEANWPTPVDATSGISEFLKGDISRNDIQPGDELEYTIYFLSSGDKPITNAAICDMIPANTTYVPGSMQMFINSNTSNLTDASADDAGTLFTPGNTPTVPCPTDNGKGAVVIKVVDSPAQLPNSTAPGIPGDSYGYIRFRVKVD